MEYRIMDKSEDVFELVRILDDCKMEIGESSMTLGQANRLLMAIRGEKIRFYLCIDDDYLVGICSVAEIFSTYECRPSGIFEDFFVARSHRKKGVGKGLVEFVKEDCKKRGLSSLLVGCADCDKEMYEHLGFSLRLGNLQTWINS